MSTGQPPVRPLSRSGYAIISQRPMHDKENLTWPRQLHSIPGTTTCRPVCRGSPFTLPAHRITLTQVRNHNDRSSLTERGSEGCRNGEVTKVPDMSQIGLTCHERIGQADPGDSDWVS